MKKRILSMVLVLVMALSLCSFSVLGASVTSFSDVPSTHWAHSSIMRMTEMGLFSGTSTPVNGVGTFSPNNSMTRAEFITVVVRYLYSDVIDSMPSGSDWYFPYYATAVSKGLFSTDDFYYDALNNPIPRQEMSFILVRALMAKGETLDTRLSDTAIPDYNSVGAAYKSSVKTAYKMGLLVGTDAKGSFNPMGILTRAEASTALYRLVDTTARVPYTPKGTDMNSSTTSEGYPVDPSKATGIYNWSVGADQKRAKITFNEGADHAIPIEGDVVVKADGTKVTIKYFHGVLRAEGCDIWTGVTLANGVKVTGEGSYGCFIGDKTAFKQSSNGELFTEAMWDYLRRNVSRPDRDGTYDGEVMNGFYKWFEEEEIVEGEYESEEDILFEIVGDWYWVGR